MPARLRAEHLYYGLSALIVLAPIVFFPSLISLYRLPKATLISVFVAGLLWLWLFLLHQEHDERVAFPLALPLISYLGLSALSLINATNPFEGTFALFQKVTCIFLFFLVVNHVKTTNAVKSILLCATVSAFIVSLIGIYQMFGGDIPGMINLSPPGSTFGNKNMAAQFILLTLPFPYLLLFQAIDRQKEILFGITASVVTTYLLYTGTRAAWAGAIIAFLIMVLFLNLKARKLAPRLKAAIVNKKGFLSVIALFIISMNFIPPFFFPEWRVAGMSSPISRFATIVEIDRDASFQNRVAMWANSIQMFQDHALLGVGKGNFKIVYPLYAERRLKDINYGTAVQPSEAHNDYIQLLAETGIFGFASFFWILCLIALRVWRSVPERGTESETAVIFALSFSVVAILVEASLDFPFELPVSEAFFWLFAGMLWILSGNHGSPSNSDVSLRTMARSWEWIPSPRAGRLMVGFFSAFSILITAVHLTFVRADFHFGRGVQLAREGALEVAVQEIRRAEFLNPTRHQYPFLRGLISYDLKKYHEAVEANLRTLKFHPYYINAYTNLGVAYASTGQIQEAESAWKRAIEIWPDHNDARNNLATTHAMYGRKDEAVALFQESLRRSPGDETARKKLDLLLRGLVQVAQ